MLAKQYRLTSRLDFKKVSSLGQPFFSPLFRIKRAKNSSDQSRLAVVTPARLSKKAVVRNRIRRQVSEILRLGHKDIIPGYDVVVWPKASALDRPYQELEKDLLFLLFKARVLKK